MSTEITIDDFFKNDEESPRGPSVGSPTPLEDTLCELTKEYTPTGMSFNEAFDTIFTDTQKYNEDTSEAAPVLRNCKVCDKPLDDWQQPLIAQQYHKDGECTKCIECHNPVSYSRIAQCIKEEIPVSHSPCYDRKLKADFEKTPVEITRGHLAYLNRLIQFAHRPNMLLSVEDNINIAGIAEQTYIMDMSMEEKFVHLKMMEAACAHVSIAIDNDKDKIRLKLERDDLNRHIKIRDLSKVMDAETLRVHMTAEKAKNAERKREKEDPILRQRNKTIKMMMASMYIDEVTAVAILDSKKVL